MERLISRRIAALTATLFCLMLSRAVRAETPAELFKKGNDAYAQGQFAQAVALYESARDQGLRHWELDYNLGNAYYKNGQVGKAIARYERAFRRHSTDRDLVFSLQLLLTKVGDPLIPPGALPGLLWHLFYALTIDTLAGVGTLLFVGACLGSGLFFLGRWRCSSGVAGGYLLALAFIALWLGLRISLSERPDAVVIVPTAEVRGGPNSTYPANFTVPEGRRVLVLEDQEPVKGWLEIGVPQEGLKGWVPESSVEIIER